MMWYRDQINEMVADVDAVCCTAESVCDRGPPVRPQTHTQSSISDLLLLLRL